MAGTWDIVSKFQAGHYDIERPSLSWVAGHRLSFHRLSQVSLELTVTWGPGTLLNNINDNKTTLLVKNVLTDLLAPSCSAEAAD